ncbi:scaffolding protein [Mycobacterium phage AlleyCat]|uniref:Scaffolding protein n=4 Tax=Kratiovirus larva TaxID=1056831 RepID=A0A221J732_9CAUD|nr:head scaffolding protein [Mycobacterium phage Larva]AEL19665.1 scaffolding protein [Mycobacterium phage Larva]ASM62516.1 scaffolding protein [Mycobacterium phage AlleyCat]
MCVGPTPMEEIPMPDVVTDNPVETSATEGGEAPKTFTQAELDRIINDRLDRERAKYAGFDDFKAKAEQFDAIKDGEKTELQREREAREAAEKRAEKAEFTALRDRIASAKGVPAGSLTGKTEEELTASADSLIAWRDQNAPKPEPKPKPRNPAGSGGGLKSGATGAGGDAIDPKERAAAALRELRGSS